MTAKWLVGGYTATLAPAAAALCTDLEELERLTVRRVFEQVGGDKEQAQKLLGISRATLYRKIKRYGIETRRRGKGRRAGDPGRQDAGWHGLSLKMDEAGRRPNGRSQPVNFRASWAAG